VDQLQAVTDARDLMAVIGRAMQRTPSTHLTVQAGEITLTGVETFVEHVGHEFEFEVTSGGERTGLVVIDGRVYPRLARPQQGRHWLRVEFATTAPVDALPDAVARLLGVHPAQPPSATVV